MSTKWLTANSSPKHESNRKNRLRKALLIFMSCTLILSTGCSLLPDEAEEEVLPEITKPTFSKKPEYEVVREDLEVPISAGGRLMSEQEELLYFSLADKRIKDVLVSNGDQVKAGQTIAVLDLEQLEKDLRSKKLALRREEVNMKKILREKETMDPVEFETAQIQYEDQVQQIADLESDIAKGTLKAPFDGTLMSLSIQKGGSTKAYETVAIVVNTSRLTVAVDMSKDEQKKIALGMEAEVSISGVEGTLKGKVKAFPIEKTNNNNNNNNGGFFGNNADQEKLENYVVVQVDNLPKNLQRGFPVSVRIVTNRIKDAITIPPTALRSIGTRNYVQVVDENGKREVDVEVGIIQATKVQILQGLEPGQKVVGK